MQKLPTTLSANSNVQDKNSTNDIVESNFTTIHDKIFIPTVIDDGKLVQKLSMKVSSKLLAQNEKVT